MHRWCVTLWVHDLFFRIPSFFLLQWNIVASVLCLIVCFHKPITELVKFHLSSSLAAFLLLHKLLLWVLFPKTLISTACYYISFWGIRHFLNFCNLKVLDYKMLFSTINIRMIWRFWVLFWVFLFIRFHEHIRTNSLNQCKIIFALNVVTLGSI